MDSRDPQSGWNFLRDLYRETAPAVFLSILAGLCLAGVWFALLVSGGTFEGFPVRLVALLCIGMVLGGAFVGLLVGVVLDTVLTALRPPRRKQPRRSRRTRRPPTDLERDWR